MSEIEQEHETEVVEIEDEDSNYEVVDQDGDSGDSDGGDEELQAYTKEAKKRRSKEETERRIRQLTAARKTAEEEAAAAVQYIQQVQSQNEEMKRRLSSLDKGYMSEFEGRISSQEAQAKRALAEAYEAGDYDRVADAQQAISQIAIEKERIRVQKSRAQAAAQQQQLQQQQVQQQQQRRPQPQPRDPKLDAWLGKNEWFEKDKVMRSAARAIHETLVAEEGYDPTTDEYYAEIDRRIRREMPHKFQGDKRNVQSVTPAGSGTRSLKSGRKKQVELNPGQVRLAEKLGVPLDKYAAQVAKLENRRD